MKAPRPVRSAARATKGGRAWRQGHAAEWFAALWLMLKGYQIIAFRLPGRAGEIDILARRGQVLAVVEVKRRATLEAALTAIGAEQHRRLLAAGRTIARRRRSLATLALRIDTVALAPGRLPRHARGVEPPTGDWAGARGEF